jgi:hypothetical protein
MPHSVSSVIENSPPRCVGLNTTSFLPLLLELTVFRKTLYNDYPSSWIHKDWNVWSYGVEGTFQRDDSERERLPPPVGIPRAPTSNIMFAHMPIQNQKPRALQYIFSRELGWTISEGLPCVVGVSIYTREHAYGNHTVPRKISFYYGWGHLESEYCGHWFGAQILPKMVIINPKIRLTQPSGAKILVFNCQETTIGP